jgi:hypothetical protein
MCHQKNEGRDSQGEESELLEINKKHCSNKTHTGGV